jgi:sugar-specific transcriptional regulator TrmB
MEELVKFLRQHLGYSEDEASVYRVALEKESVTSGSVCRSIQDLRPSTAKDILDRLATRGLLTQTPRKAEQSGTQPGKGEKTHYKVIPPDVAFAEFSDKYQKFKSDLDKIGEHLEVRSETEQLNSEIWLTRSPKIASRQAAGIISGAKESLKIYGHDCSWLADADLKDAVMKAAEGNVRVEIVATDLNRNFQRSIQSAGVKTRITDFVTMPFCLVDNSRLLMPHPSGEVKREFGLLSTTNQYMVNHYLETFGSMTKVRRGDRS